MTDDNEDNVNFRNRLSLTAAATDTSEVWFSLNFT